MPPYDIKRPNPPTRPDAHPGPAWRWLARQRLVGLSLSLGALCWGACSSSTTAPPKSPDPQVLSRPPCPAQAPAPPVLPFHHPLHDHADFWLANADYREGLVIDTQSIQQHNRQVLAQTTDGRPSGRWDPMTLKLTPAFVRQRLHARLEHLHKGVAKGTRVLKNGEIPRELLQALQQQTAEAHYVEELRMVHRTSALRCFPSHQGIYEEAWDLSFDLMQCAQVREGELVRVAAKGPDYWYIWTSYADGWVKPQVLTPPLKPTEAQELTRSERFVVIQKDRLPLWSAAEGGHLRGEVRLGARLPLLQDQGGRLQVLAPGPTGLSPAWLRAKGVYRGSGSGSGPSPEGLAPELWEVSVGYPALTRGALFQRAFTLLNTPYGWGGVGGSRDCSRMMMDLFNAFGVLQPRNTWHQSLSGNRRIEVGELTEAAKREAIEEAAKGAIVLLYMKGHIMLFLGRDGDHLYALHLFSGYLVPCEGGGETMHRVNRTVITALELGLGSSRRSFLQRINRLILLEHSRQ